MVLFIDMARTQFCINNDIFCGHFKVLTDTDAWGKAVSQLQVWENMKV